MRDIERVKKRSVRVVSMMLTIALILTLMPMSMVFATSNGQKALNELEDLNNSQRAAILGLVWDYVVLQKNTPGTPSFEEVMDEIENTLEEYGIEIVDGDPSSNEISQDTVDYILEQSYENRGVLNTIYDELIGEGISKNLIKSALGANTDAEVLAELIKYSDKYFTKSGGKLVRNTGITTPKICNKISALSDTYVLNKIDQAAEIINDSISSSEFDLNDVISALKVYDLYKTPTTSGGTGGGGSSSSSDDTDTTDVTTTEPTNDTDSGVHSVVTVKPEVTKTETGAVKAESKITSETFADAVDKAVADNEGVKTIEVKVDKVEGADTYAVSLPKNALVSSTSTTGTAAEKKIIQIETELGTISAPNNMFKANEVGDAKNIELSIEIVAAESIPGITEEEKAKIGSRPIIDLNATADGKKLSFNNPEAPVAVAVPYEPTPEELKDPEHIVIVYIDDAGNVTSVPNGRYNKTTGKVEFSTSHFSKYAIAYVEKTFEDIKEYSWAKKAIEVMASKGVINGMSDKEFYPSSNIKRADFTVMVIKALGLSAKIDDNFADVTKNDYYYNEVGIAKKLDIITGAGDNSFNPQEQITRQDMMVIANRALIAAGKMEKSDTADLTAYTDNDAVAAYAKSSVAALTEAQIVKGYNNMIDPMSNTTRAEAAVIIYRMFNK